MAEERSFSDAVAEPDVPLPISTQSTDFLKEDHEANVSAALEGVLKETASVCVPEKGRNRLETPPPPWIPPRLPPRISSEEIPPKSSSTPVRLPEISENTASPISFDDSFYLSAPIFPNSPPNSTDSEGTEDPYPLHGKHPTTLDPIPEHTTPPNVSERESSSHTISIPIPTENQPIPDPSLLPTETDCDLSDSDNSLVSAKTCSLYEKEVSTFPEDIDTKPLAMLSIERLSIVTAMNESSSLGSSNDIFISTKTSTENTVDPKPKIGNEPASNQAIIALQKIMPSNLGEDAKQIFQAATEKLFEDPKMESQNFDTMPAKSCTNVEQASSESADIRKVIPVVSSVKEKVETVGESFKMEERLEIVAPLHQSLPPVMIDSVEEPIIDVVDTSSTEAHTDPTEFHATPSEVHTSMPEVHTSMPEAHTSLTEAHTGLTEVHTSPSEDHTNTAIVHTSPNEFQTSLTEVNSSLTKVHTNLIKVHTSLCEFDTSPTELHTNPTEIHASPTELHAISNEVYNSVTEVHASRIEVRASRTEVCASRTEVHDSRTYVHDSLAKVHFSPLVHMTSPAEVNTNTTEAHTSPTEALNSPTEALNSPIEVHVDPVEVYKNNEYVNITIPETSQSEPSPAGTELEIWGLENTLVGVLKDITQDPPTSLAPLPKEKPTEETPIRQSDRLKDPDKRQTSKTAAKTVKPVVKTATRTPSNPQVANSGKSGSIAATTSSSATSALSPRSDKSIKQIKSSRPASATSARGFHGDLSCPSSGLCVMTSSLTGPQRVAAARAAAAAAGVKRKVSTVAASSVLADGIRSPREKQSVTSTNSIVNAVTASNNSVTSALQKRTSTVSGSLATSAQHSNTARRGAASDGHRALGHGGPSQLGIHGPHQKSKTSNDIKSLEETYSAILKSFVDAKKEIQLKTKLAVEMFSEVERLRHIAVTKFGKDLPLKENVSGLGEVASVTRPATGAGEQMFSDEDNRTIAIAESVLKALTSQRTSLLNEAIHHHANLMTCCWEATGDEGSPILFSEKQFADQLPARLSEAAAVEQSRIAEVLQVLRTSLSDLEETKACIRDLRSQLELLNQENSTLTSSLADCTKELEELRTEFGKTTARKMAAEKETKVLRIRLKEAETKVAAEEQKCKDLSNQVQSLENKIRSKEMTVEQRVKETEKKCVERAAKEQEDKERRMTELLQQKQQKQLKESQLEATCQQLESSLENVKQLLQIRTVEKERIEEELRATSEKLSRIAMHRPAVTEISHSEREDILQRLHAMIAGEDISTGPKLQEELQALADLLNERDQLITEKDSEIKRLKDSSNESGDSRVSKEDYLKLQLTLTTLASHNEKLEQELSKMLEAAAKRDRVMSEQERVLVIRDQLIALLEGSNHPAGNVGTAGANSNPVAIQKKMLELQTTVERQTVRIKALEAQLANTEEHQDGLQNLRTRYERRIAQLEHALSDHRVAHSSVSISFL